MEDSPPTRRRNITRFDQLESMFEGAMENPDLPRVLTDNVENLLFVWSALIQSKGQPGWLASAKDALGNPIFDAAEAAKIELQIAPFASALLSYSCGNKQPESTVQQGGGSGSSSGIDEIFHTVRRSIDTMNQKVDEFANSYGILGMERKDDAIDKDYNLGPIGIPFIPLDGSFSFNILSKIPLPLRTIVFISNVTLDALRLLVSIPGMGSPFLRKMLSIGLAVLELLQGDWKQALLSFAGTYSNSAVYVGLFGKVFLDVFSMINPEFQEQIVDGIIPVSKSLLIGFLLKGFQILAPAQVRRLVINELDKFKALKESTDEGLQGAGLSPRPEYYAPTFEDIQTVQSFIRDRGLICTKEYLTLMSVMNQSIFIKLPFQLLGLPMDEETHKEMCKGIAELYPGGVPDTIAEGIVGDALERKGDTGTAEAVAEAVPANASTVPVTPAASAVPAEAVAEVSTVSGTTEASSKTPKKAVTETPVKTPLSAPVTPVVPAVPVTPAVAGVSTGTRTGTPSTTGKQKGTLASARRALRFGGGKTHRANRILREKTKTRRSKSNAQ